MKNLKKIGAALLAVAMLCSMSVVAFAAETDTVDAVVPGSSNDSEIAINSAKVEKSSGILTVTLDYSISGTVETGDQITMLGYIFDSGDNASEVAVVTGNIRAIDQAAAVAENGQISFKLATTGEGYTVAEGAKMVVKLGSDAASVTKAQAFFIDLAAVTESGLKGDANGDETVDGRDAIAVQMYYLNPSVNPLDRPDLADVDGNVGIDGRDAIALQMYYLNPTANPLQ